MTFTVYAKKVLITTRHILQIILFCSQKEIEQHTVCNLCTHCTLVLHTDNRIGYRKNHISAVFFVYRYWIGTKMKKAADTNI